ncbi:MAG: stage III sporulation protein AE [Clostridia bacterium]|jgi:stage III sporulation protein AE|nr:stage III sporulation protein AE [Clostridia bacterium]
MKMKNNNTRLLIIIIIFVITVALSFIPHSCIVAEDTDDTYGELQEQITIQLNSLDFGEFEKLLSDLDSDEYKIFGNTSFLSKVKTIISGDLSGGYDNVFSAIFSIFFSEILSFMPLLATIMAITILCSLISQIRSNVGNKSVADIVHFVCYGVVIVLIVSAIMQLVNVTTNALNSMKTQMDIAFPILLTIMTALGSTVSVSVYKPAVLLLSGGIMQIFNSIVLPIFIFATVFSIISNLSGNVKLDKFVAFFNSAFKYIVGFVFTIFMAFLSIQGITAATHDGISIRTAKFALKSYVPILGGYLSEGFDLILAGSVLIKNAVGVSGLLLMIATIIMPIVKIAVFILMLKLVSAILEPIADSRISSFLSSAGKNLSMLNITIIGVAFMYFITVVLVMCTSNVL